MHHFYRQLCVVIVVEKDSLFLLFGISKMFQQQKVKESKIKKTLH